jgi:hypothetical protein
MSREADRTEALRREITRAIVLQTGTREQVALPFADAVLAYLQSEYAGQRLYVPAPARQHDLLQISAALVNGASPWRVCRDFGLSRRTLNRLFPGGLPKAQKSAIAPS